MKAIMRKVICVLAAMAVMVGFVSPEVKAAKISYSTYNNGRFGYSVKYPTTFTAGSKDDMNGARLSTADGKARVYIWNSYGMNRKRNGKSVVATAKKNRKIKVIKQTAKEGSYSFVSGKNVTQYYYYFPTGGEIAFQITYPKSQKKYYGTAIKAMMKSAKANKKLVLQGN